MLLLASSSIATASWSGFGSNEPSTSYDTDRFMFDSPPPADDLDYVYFNAYPIESYGLLLDSPNPNVGALGTSVRPPLFGWQAMLGLWKDCNNDGYVGLVESAVTTYRAELLTNAATCPPGESIYNDGVWVREFIVFAQLDPCTWASPEDRAAASGHACQGFAPSAFALNSPGQIFVNNTKVWGDSFKPDFKTNANPGSTCPISPVPQGTTSHTGLLIRYMDCFVPITGVLAVADRNVTEATGESPGLAFEDANNPQDSTEHPLIFSLPITLYDDPYKPGQDGLISEGTKSGGDPAFTAWDCRAAPFAVARDPTSDPGQPGQLRRISVTDPTGALPSEIVDPTGELDGDDDDGNLELTNEDGEYAGRNVTDENGEFLTVWQPSPSVNNPTGSYYDALNETDDGIDDDCERDDDTFLTNGQTTLDSKAVDSSSQSKGKVTSDWTFRYSGGALNPGSTENLKGTPVLPDQTWISDSIIVGSTPVTGGVRNDLSPGNPPYYTFYAAIDMSLATSKGYQLPGGAGNAVYGEDQCTAVGPGAAKENGWECDPAKWYVNAVGTNTAPKYVSGMHRSANVGAAYHLRDVDCFDSSVMGFTSPTVTPCS